MFRAFGSNNEFKYIAYNLCFTQTSINAKNINFNNGTGSTGNANVGPMGCV